MGQPIHVAMTQWLIIPGIEDLDHTDLHVLQVVLEHSVVGVDGIYDLIQEEGGLLLAISQHATPVNHVPGLAHQGGGGYS